MQIRQIAGRGFTGINHYDPATGSRRSLHSLIEHRMRPGRIAAGQHQQVGQLQVFITAGNQIPAKGPFMGCNGRRHAQAGIGIHVGCADKPLGEFVGHVIIFRQ